MIEPVVIRLEITMAGAFRKQSSCGSLSSVGSSPGDCVPSIPRAVVLGAPLIPGAGVIAWARRRLEAVFFASRSASSLPMIPLWLGAQETLTRTPAVRASARVFLKSC